MMLRKVQEDLLFPADSQHHRASGRASFCREQHWRAFIRKVVMQLFTLINTLVQGGSTSSKQHHNISTYSVVPLSQDSGVIGWIPGCDTLNTLVKAATKGATRRTTSSCRTYVSTIRSPSSRRSDNLKPLQWRFSGNDLKQVLWLKSANSKLWLDKCTNYTSSPRCHVHCRLPAWPQRPPPGQPDAWKSEWKDHTHRFSGLLRGDM